jgi:hypothetical protein
MALSDVENDASGPEQSEVAFFIGRDLPERMDREMRGLFHLGERDQADVVGLADFLERPTNVHVAGQARPRSGKLQKR